jgi:hypothetical protein
MLTYRMLLSSKERVEVKGMDASDAMQKALERYPGATVCECYSGCKEWHTVHTPVGNYEAPPAWIDYEVPPHFPYLPKDDGGPILPEATFAFMDELQVVPTPVKASKRKRQVGAKERTHA